jgi:hypothetical protein
MELEDILETTCLKTYNLSFIKSQLNPHYGSIRNMNFENWGRGKRWNIAMERWSIENGQQKNS